MARLNAAVHTQPTRGFPLWGSSLALLLFVALQAWALDPANDVYQYNCRSWTRQNGLPADGVTAITQTRDGYIWLGTPMGLERFDGVDFKPLDMSHLRSTVVSGLCSSPSGGLWLALDHASFAFCDGSTVVCRGRSEWGGTGLSVHGVLESRDGDIWIAGQNLTGRLEHGKHYVPVLNRPGEKDFYDNAAIYEDPTGRIWLGTTGRGLYWWWKGVLTKFPDPALDHLTIYSLAMDKQGWLWVGTQQGVLCYDGAFHRKPSPFPWYESRVLLVDREGTLWAGTSGGGLARLADGAPTLLGKANGLADDFVTALFQDREGSLWVGTRNGLCQLSDVKIPTFGKTEGLGADQDLSVFPGRNGGLWISTSQGITSFKNGTARTYAAEAGLANTYVKRVLEASNGDVYLINGSMDVEVMSGGRIVARYPNMTWPTAMTEDAHGVIVAVGGVLYRVGTNSYRPFVLPPGQEPIKCWMFNLLAARDGSIWTASAEGICRVGRDSVQILTGPDPLGNSKANFLCEDPEGVIWAGLETGIARIKNGQVRFIGRKNGLLDNQIFALVADDYGSMWMDSGRGFFRVSRRSLNDVADGKLNHLQCAAYSGLEAVKTFERSQQELSGCKTLDGRVWFPTAQGVVMINPTNIAIDPVPPSVYVDNVRANGKATTETEHLVVRPGDGDVEIHYTALSYRAPQSIRFQYRLDGRDREWVDAGSRRVAMYTNLKPGDYTFQVIAANADGVWNTTGDTLELRLLPHFYQTLWFYCLCGLAAAGAIAGGYTWRVRKLHGREKILRETQVYLDAKIKERTGELADANRMLMDEVLQRKRAQSSIEAQKLKLEKEIEERKRMEVEVERVHRQLVDASRHAGQAEVASSVLHNVGNVLNSVNVSATVASNRLRNLQISNLLRAAQMLEQHAGDLGQFLTSDEKGRKLPQYFGKLARHLGQEQSELLGELKQLSENVEHIKEIVAMQQSYAKVAGVVEKAAIAELVDSGLKMHAAAYQRHSIRVVREYEKMAEILVDRHKILQILVNIFHNAKYACDEGRQTGKTVTVRIRKHGEDRVRIEIADNGIGIAPENLTRIFSHGYTTRKNGHGFGLHSAALAARQMGGMLTVQSAGVGQGATFILELPPAATDSATVNPAGTLGG